MPPTPTPDELGKRLAAARGYNRETTEAFAKRVKTHRTTLPKWEGGAIPERSRAGVIRDYMDVTGLPEEFFCVSFDALAEAWRKCGGDGGASEPLPPPGPPSGLIPEPDKDADEDDA